MTQFSKTKLAKAVTLTLAASFLATAALPIAQAEAGHRKWKGEQRHHRNSGGEALAAGVIGFAIGAIIADQASRSRPVYVEPQPIYVEPRPIYVEPQPRYEEPRPAYHKPRRPLRDYDEPRVIRYEETYSASYEPWTPEWADWCDNKYRSFNPNTGTFRGYDGRDHFCVVQ